MMMSVAAFPLTEPVATVLDALSLAGSDSILNFANVNFDFFLDEEERIVCDGTNFVSID